MPKKVIVVEIPGEYIEKLIAKVGKVLGSLKDAKLLYAKLYSDGAEVSTRKPGTRGEHRSVYIHNGDIGDKSLREILGEIFPESVDRYLSR